jgi:hypothetical protein
MRGHRVAHPLPGIVAAPTVGRRSRGRSSTTAPARSGSLAGTFRGRESSPASAGIRWISPSPTVRSGQSTQKGSCRVSTRPRGGS